MLRALLLSTAILLLGGIAPSAQAEESVYSDNLLELLTEYYSVIGDAEAVGDLDDLLKCKKHGELLGIPICAGTCPTGKECKRKKSSCKCLEKKDATSIIEDENDYDFDFN